MRRLLSLLFAVFVMVGLLFAVPAAADDDYDDDDEGGTYLALGDSVAAGTQQPAPFTDNGYTNKLYRMLEGEYEFDNFVNLACPGEDTVEMISAPGGPASDGSICYGPGAPLPPGGSSQLDAAVGYLLAHPGEVKLITITMGANDILACDTSAPPEVLNACLVAQLGQIAANLPVIVGTLQAVAPGVPIVAMNYYNPNLAFWIVDPAIAEASLQLTPLFNGTLQQIYDALGVPVADVAKAFRTFDQRGNNVPHNVRLICKFTLMCERQGGVYVLSDYDPVTPGPQTDIHPSNKGYRNIAKTFFKVIERNELLDD